MSLVPCSASPGLLCTPLPSPCSRCGGHLRGPLALPAGLALGTPETHRGVSPKAERGTAASLTTALQHPHPHPAPLCPDTGLTRVPRAASVQAAGSRAAHPPTSQRLFHHELHDRGLRASAVPLLPNSLERVWPLPGGEQAVTTPASLPSGSPERHLHPEGVSCWAVALGGAPVGGFTPSHTPPWAGRSQDPSWIC